jgi:hypothetical protein
LDTQLFDAYNHRDLPTLGAMVSDDLEFYHDQTGLSVGKAPFIAAIKQNICGKVERAIVPGSMGSMAPWRSPHGGRPMEVALTSP